MESIQFFVAVLVAMSQSAWHINAAGKPKSLINYMNYQIVFKLYYQRCYSNTNNPKTYLRHVTKMGDRL